MITDAILGLIYFFVAGIVLLFSVLDDVVLSTSLTSGVDSLTGYYSALDVLLPMGTILGIIAFDVTFESALLVYRGIKWTYQKVPGIS